MISVLIILSNHLWSKYTSAKDFLSCSLASISVCKRTRSGIHSYYCTMWSTLEWWSKYDFETFKNKKIYCIKIKITIFVIYNYKLNLNQICRWLSGRWRYFGYGLVHSFVTDNSTHEHTTYATFYNFKSLHINIRLIKTSYNPTNHFISLISLFRKWSVSQDPKTA